MAYFKRENRSGGNRNYGNDRPELFKATCSNCGNMCEVPFKPTGSKPVYCRDCFQKMGGANTNMRNTRGSEERKMYNAVCTSCGTNCQIPFQPSQGRDVFCSRCFEKNQGGEAPRFNRSDRPQATTEQPNYKAQFETLNAKMDKILTLLTQVEESPILETIASEVKVKKAKKKSKSPKKTSSKKK